MRIDEFLLARIAEDEAMARESVCQCGGPVCNTETGWFRREELMERFDGSSRAVPHILAWSPARVLAECAAKRAVVAAHPLASAEPGYSPQDFGCQTCHEDDGFQHGFGNCDTLLALAQPFADHPDFDPAWNATP